MFLLICKLYICIQNVFGHIFYSSRLHLYWQFWQFEVQKLAYMLILAAGGSSPYLSSVGWGGSSLSSCLIWSSWSKCSWPRWSSWSRWSYGLDGHHGQDRQDRGDRQDRQSLKARQDITHIFAGGVLKDLQNRYDCHWVHPVHCIFLVNKKISFITFIFSKKLWSRTLYYIVCIWYLIDSKWFLF